MIEYLTDRAGFDSKWESNKDLVTKIYTDDKLIGDEYTNVRLICVMSEGLTSGEVRGCIDRKMKEIEKKNSTTPTFLKAQTNNVY